MEEKPKDAVDLDSDIAAASSSGPMSGINPTDVSTIKAVQDRRFNFYLVC